MRCVSRLGLLLDMNIVADGNVQEGLLWTESDSDESFTEIVHQQVQKDDESIPRQHKTAKKDHHLECQTFWQPEKAI